MVLAAKTKVYRVLVVGVLAAGWACAGRVVAGEPDPRSYWNVADIRSGMKGYGRTVMVGTKLEEFKAEVLGVMRDVSPGRDMVLCRLQGCDLEHAGIIQGMSGSPIWIEGKLLGAVAFAWEFAKDPIAGVTPFSQMIQYVRSSDRRIAAERGLGSGKGRVATGMRAPRPILDAAYDPYPRDPRDWDPPVEVSESRLGGMRPIVTPLAVRGFGARSLATLARGLEPLGMAPMSAGGAPERIIREEGDKPLLPGSPLSIALVLGDFDISGIGTVTHVEGDRVYGFGHPMMSLGACELPMMTGYIHTVYPRASVSMKMGSPLKVVGVIDADVSTSVSGRIGPAPDLLPLAVTVKTGQFADPHTYRVRIIREPRLLSTLVLSVLTNAIDTEGNLPEELTARLKATIKLKGREPIVFSDVYSGARYTGLMGGPALFNAVASIVAILSRNSVARVRIESIECDLTIEPGRTTAQLESARLVSDEIEPGGVVRALVALKPYRGEIRTVEVTAALPADFPEGPAELVLCDMAGSIRRGFRNNPTLLEPQDVEGLLQAIRMQIAPRRTDILAHLPTPRLAVSVGGRTMDRLPGSAHAVFTARPGGGVIPLHCDLVAATPTPFVIEGSQTLKFTVSRNTGRSLATPAR